MPELRLGRWVETVAKPAGVSAGLRAVDAREPASVLGFLGDAHGVDAVARCERPIVLPAGSGALVMR